MPALRRHLLVHLADAGWDEAFAPAIGEVRDALTLWRQAALPLVVASQDGVPEGRVRLGLPAPASLSRRRIALVVRRAHLLGAEEFPPAPSITPLLDPESRPAWRALAELLPGARVYGGYGWQCLSGLEYVHAASDIDLLLPVDGPAQADAVAARLDLAARELPRLDGELVFPDGSAVAWREWRWWRLGRAGELLVKHLDGARLERDLAWPAAA